MSPLLVQEIEDEPSNSTSPPTAIELTEVESTLRQLLLDVAAYIDANPTSPNSEAQVHLPPDLENEPLVLRFTGGWVRDKLLGVGSHDIDVAINKMTGYQFGLRLKEYLELPGNPEKYGLEGVGTNDKAGATDKSKTVGGLHKIEANPEKSKHLETVTTKIMGLDIDLVNLRRETYTAESRNPVMEFGTPEEDALRRDATINAMFYNLNTSQIEDFTTRGRADLAAGILRTPMDPYQTFEDDPLRVLRLIRFASRLGYEIEAGVKGAMGNEGIQRALMRKITRERIGTEIEKALRGPDPFGALALIEEVGLYGVVFCDPTAAAAEEGAGTEFEPDVESWKGVLEFLKDVSDTDGPLNEILLQDAEHQYLAWQLAALIPYRDAPQPQPSEPGKRLPPPVAAAVAREGIKATNKVCEIVTAAVRNQEEISNLVDKFDQQKRRPDKKIVGEDATARDVLGMAIRRWGASWRSQVVWALLGDVANDLQNSQTIQRRYASSLKHLSNLNLLEAHTFKPLMDGKTLAKALDTSPGPWMKDALDVVMAYQLRNPDTANAEDAVAEVRADREGEKHVNGNGNVRGGGESLRSSLVRHFLGLTIRPMFLKAKPTAITETGRKNHQDVLPAKITVEGMDDGVNKPWKAGKEGKEVLDLLRWCVGALDGQLVEEVWHLVVPPLLTLVDDWEVKYKTLGAGLVEELLKVTPPALLAKTGLGKVFEEALMPCLTYLPTITPEEESVPLLNAVYPALITLSRVRFSPPPSKSSSTTNKPGATANGRRTPYTIYLDTLIRKGPIYTYTLCAPSTSPTLTSTIFRHLASLLNESGIESVKHLKYILPMITETLSNRLLVETKQFEVLGSVVRALQTVVLNGWPRMVGYRGEVLKGLVMCWVRLDDLGEGEEEVEELRGEMRETVKMLRCVVDSDGNVDFEKECELLIKADGRVKSLLEQ